MSNLSHWTYEEKNPGIAYILIFFEKIAKIGKFHGIRKGKIIALGNFM